jgi:hypothetical protein
MAWVLNNPVVTAPIIGATKPHHIDDAAAAVDIDLAPDEVTALQEHYTVRAAGGFWNRALVSADGLWGVVGDVLKRSFPVISRDVFCFRLTGHVDGIKHPSIVDAG